MSGQGIAQFIPLILIFIIFYFFLIRPQQKRVKDHKVMVESLKRGDEVITSGGIIGIVDRVMEDDRIEVTIGENTKVMVFNRAFNGSLANIKSILLSIGFKKTTKMWALKDENILFLQTFFFSRHGLF